MIHKKTIVSCLFLAASVVLIAATFLLPYCLDNAQAIAVARAEYVTPDYSGDPEADQTPNLTSKPVVVSEIEDLRARNSVLYVNHTPEKFVFVEKYYGQTGRIERLDHLTHAMYGTLQFIFFNLDASGYASNEAFQDKVASITEFNGGTPGYFYLSLMLPACFDAATIYVSRNYLATVGDMGEYAGEDYLAPFRPFVTHQKKLAPQTIEFQLPKKRTSIMPNRLEAATIITVHYRAENGLNFAGNLPLLGEPAAVAKSVQTRGTVHIVGISVAASLTLAFAMLLLLKRNAKLLGQLGILMGAALLFAAGFVPLIAGAGASGILEAISVGILLLSALLAAQVGYRGSCFKFWLAALGARIGLCVLVVASGSVSFGVSAKVAACILSALSVGFGALKWTRDRNAVESAGILLACVAALTVVFMPFSALSTLHPATAVASLSALTSLWFIFTDIFRTERRNVALTKNLQAEIAAQTKVLAGTLSDRERILTYVSHDLKKSALGIDACLTDLQDSNMNERQAVAAAQIERSTQTLLSDFSEILQFSKQNYSNEPFTSVSLPALFSELQTRVASDCNANGIAFCARTKNITVRAKKTALMSALFNLIFNAVEHSDCTEINLSAKRSYGGAIITVSDNGKGIEDTAQIFAPFITSSESTANSGLGLFIVKSEIESMGGTVACTAAERGTTFRIELLSEE